MDSAQGYCELVADLEPHRAGLGEPQMVGVGGASSTDKAGLRGNEFEVGFVAETTGGPVLIAKAYFHFESGLV
jgi:hypothetical protein